MKKVIPFLKNKYLISSTVVVLYILLLHDTDVFSLINKRSKISDLKEQIEVRKGEIMELKTAMAELEDTRALEKYAREEHLFKKEDEDLFVFSFE